MARHRLSYIFFRTDASSLIGTGHVMRCLTLADELTENGTKARFICREESGNMISYIEKRGYEAHPLPSGIDSETDRKLSQSFLEKHSEQIDWLVVDHYDLDACWESYMRSAARKIMVIDDIANRPHDCDLLLNQNYGFPESQYKKFVPNGCFKLLGPNYALLNPQFRKARENLRKRNGEIRRIMVFLGGADPSNETSKVLRAIQMLSRPDIFTDVVIGVSNTYRKEVEAMVSQLPNTICHFHVDNMAELMATADLSIGASGTTTWERCCVGLPSLVITIAHNQVDIAENLDKSGIIINLGWYERVTEDDIKSAVESLIHDFDKINTISSRGKEIVDGKGAERVAEEIYKQK